MIDKGDLQNVPKHTECVKAFTPLEIIRHRRTTVAFGNLSLSGFTLLEILLTIIIMTVVLIPLMQIMPEGMKYTTRLEQLTKAAFLAQNKFDDIRNQVLGTNTSYGFSHSYTQSSTAFASPDNKFKFTVSDDGNATLKTLSLAVWFDEDSDNSLDSGEANVTLDSKVAKRN